MYIVSITTKSRMENIPEVQEILTKNGEKITTRLGIHNPDRENAGVIIIAYTANDVEELIEELKSIKDVEANFMKV